MAKSKFSNIVAGHSYYYLSIPYYGDWKNAKIIGPAKCAKLSDFQNMVAAEENDVVAKEELEKLKEDIRSLADMSYKNSYKAKIDACENCSTAEKQELWWVFAEYVCHVHKIGIRAGKVAYKDMYEGNCFETKEQAEKFFDDLVHLFAKYGIIITRINNQFA